MFRQTSLIVALILGSTGLLPAQESTTQPTTAPATQPTDSPRVLLMPFGEITDGPSHDWIGRAIEQSLLADLSRINGIKPVVYLNTANANKVMDPIAAIKAGREMDADILIFGSYQIVGDSLRITGQIFDADSAEPIGGLKASGKISDLFTMEDTLGAQVRTAIGAELAGVPPAEILRGGQPMPEISSSGPVRVGPGYEGSTYDQSLSNNKPYWSYYYNTYPSYYYAPYRYYRPYYNYSYPSYRPHYPYYGGGTVFFFSNNFDDKHRFHGHGRFDRKFDGKFGRDFDGRRDGIRPSRAFSPSRSERIGPNTNYIRPQSRNDSLPPGQGVRGRSGGGGTAGRALAR